MSNKLAGWHETIVALATPPGIGAIGMIRLSGKESVRIANELFPSKDLSEQPSHTLHVGYLKDEGEVLDEVVISIFRAPKSYTGEDVIEISCHGSPYLQEQVIAACVKHGARLARPGEFTMKAFLNGKLDLSQAEAVADLIASNSAASLKTALHTMRGGFSSTLSALREQLLKFSALMELELDFSQEDVEFADRTQFYALIGELETTTYRLLDSFKLGNVIRHGVQVAIIGKPNAGKSTLLNTLLNEDRAIVSDIAGTTRDTIEEVLNIEGILFRLIDTAGLREHTSDIIESIGVGKSLEKMEQADVVLYLFDVKDLSAEELREATSALQAKGAVFLTVGNKADVADMNFLERKFGVRDNLLFISAKNATGIDELKSALVRLVTGGSINTENTIVTNARHFAALQEVAKSLADIRAGLDNKIPGDLVALDIRRCLHFLGEITGEITNDEQLGWIFGKFCIGK
ncbi:MAG TPA: tRNA uridine-5-carboxymethylaminomethyl(34) synthesis GTPase MnmE [Chitinophagaceae bacterium]|nr:tRNA uridine-5-carboxymethylaminomethyl(34) synthesis GTPase MnmE [Chitinophagaceae bacterium]